MSPPGGCYKNYSDADGKSGEVLYSTKTFLGLHNKTVLHHQLNKLKQVRTPYSSLVVIQVPESLDIPN